MFSIRKPTNEQVRAYLARQAAEPWPYSFVGATREPPARRPGWNIDHQRVLLGQGEAKFLAAKQAILRWQMFPFEMATLLWPDEPPTERRVAAVRFWILPLGIWMLIPVRVVYVLDEPRRFGFAYGTLPDHVERGEERFLVEWLPDDSVWYDLAVISRPGHWLSWLGYPYMRRQQARFRRMSAEALRRHTSP